jgi:hypothetical protein
MGHPSAGSRDLATLWALAAAMGVIAGTALYYPEAATAALPPDAGTPPSPTPLLTLAVGTGIAAVYGLLAWVGWRARRGLRWPGAWDPAVGAGGRFILPALIGIALGVLFILVDLLLAPINGVGRLPHPTFPFSLLASLSAAIGEEILFRLFLIAGLLALVRRFRGADSTAGRGREDAPVSERAFWVVVGISALAFAASHIPGMLYIAGDLAAASLAVLVAQLVVLNGALSVVAAELLRRYGVLAAMGVHFWADIIWHVLWGH